MNGSKGRIIARALDSDQFKLIDDKRNSIRIRKALENRTNMEDDRVAILEAQLSQAKLIAEEADKKYEEVEN